MPSQFKGASRWPKLGFIIVSLLAIALLVSLGIWQLRRADEKRAIDVAFKERDASEPLLIGDTKLQLPGSEYYPGIAQGRFDSTHIVFLDNQTYQGHVGYHVLVPLRVAGGKCGILVNFGWVSMGLNRQQLPVIEIPDSQVTAQGTLRRPPRAPFFLGDEGAQESTGWPRRVQYVDVERLQSQLGYCLQPLVLQLAPEEPYGFVRQWAAPVSGMERHIAYAVQWFAMALAAMIVAVISYRRGFGKSKRRNNGKG